MASHLADVLVRREGWQGSGGRAGHGHADGGRRSPQGRAVFNPLDRGVTVVSPVGDTTADRQNFGKMLLVFGCIGNDFCK